jgi:DNA-binding XRE family transcriptional regulator
MSNKVQTTTININEAFSSAAWNIRLKAIRVLNGLTQQEAANMIGTSRSVYQVWEKGTYIPLEINKASICRVFSVPESLIFG